MQASPGTRAATSATSATLSDLKELQTAEGTSIGLAGAMKSVGNSDKIPEQSEKRGAILVLGEDLDESAMFKVMTENRSRLNNEKKPYDILFLTLKTKELFENAASSFLDKSTQQRVVQEGTSAHEEEPSESKGESSVIKRKSSFNGDLKGADNKESTLSEGSLVVRKNLKEEILRQFQSNNSLLLSNAKLNEYKKIYILGEGLPGENIIVSGNNLYTEKDIVDLFKSRKLLPQIKDFRFTSTGSGEKKSADIGSMIASSVSNTLGGSMPGVVCSLVAGAVFGRDMPSFALSVKNELVKQGHDDVTVTGYGGKLNFDATQMHHERMINETSKRRSTVKVVFQGTPKT